MTEFYKNAYEVELFEKFPINRGYTVLSLQLIAMIKRRNLSLKHINKCQIILIYQENCIIFQTNKHSEKHRIESLYCIHINHNAELLFVIFKSLPDVRYVQSYLFKLEHQSDAFQIATFINVQSSNMNSLPYYSTLFFERNNTINNPLNSLIRKFEVDEVKILNVKNVSKHHYKTENFPRDWMHVEENLDKDENCKLYDIYAFPNIQPNKDIIDSDNCYYQSLVKSYRIFLIVTTDVSIQFLDTKLKKLNTEVFYIDIKEIIRQIGHLNRVLILVKFIINNFEYSLESIYLEFIDDNNCKKFVDTLCKKGEIQYNGLRLCPSCPMIIINKFSQDLNEEINDFQFDIPEKMQKYGSLIRIQNMINIYLEKIEDQINQKISDTHFADRIITIFERLFKYYENLQFSHNCNLKVEDKTDRKMSSKIWENVKNIFTKKLSVENKNMDTIDGYNVVLEKKNVNTTVDGLQINDDNGLQLRNITSRTRRALSFSECILQRPTIIPMKNENKKLDSIFVSSNKTLRKSIIYSSNLLRNKNKIHLKSFALVAIAAQKLMKLCRLKWNFEVKEIISKQHSFNISDFKNFFGPNEIYAYSLNTMVNHSYEKIDREWTNIILERKEEFSQFKKVVTDGVSLIHRKNAWKLMIQNSSQLTAEKIFKHDINPNFQNILLAMIKNDIFECDSVKEIYMKSFVDFSRVNSDIINDVGRTMPQISYFGIQVTGQLALYNVLRAYAFLDPDVSYCQGMNFIVAIFLLYMNEEESFIALIFYMIFLERREIYLPSMIGIKHCFYKLERLVTDFCPALNYHLLEINFPISLYASSWVMTLFANNYPIHFVIRVFDMLFAEGSIIIYNISITLISYVADRVLQSMEFDMIYEHFCKNLNSLSDDDLIQILHKASEINITRNLRIYELELTCDIKDNLIQNEFIQKLCIENIDLRLETVIFRKKIELLQKELLELKKKLKN